jgi:hypothetical protein
MGELSQIVVEQDEDCFTCGRHLASGDLATRDNRTSRVMCLSCSELGTSEVEVTGFVNFGTPGGAAQREYDRRRGRERKTLKQTMPFRIGFTLVLMFVARVFGNHLHKGEGSLFAVLVFFVSLASMLQRRQSTEAWATGAKGERIVAARLAKVASQGVVTIHDRRIPGSRANIDHIAVGPSGVFVIDTKMVKGRVAVKTTGPIFNRGPVRLLIQGRDRSSYIEGMERQIAAVEKACRSLGWASSVNVQPLVVLVGAEVGFFARPWRIRGVWVGWPREMARVVSKSGTLTKAHVQQLAQSLASQLPAA